MMTSKSLLLLVLFGGMSCATQAPQAPDLTMAPSAASAPQVPRLAVMEPAAALQQLADPQAIVLDVRTPAEFATGHLDRAQNIDFRASDFSEQVARLDPRARYVLYCASGNRSTQAAAIMQKLGFTNLANAGSYSALQAAGGK